jgi:hypothetical protein
MAWAIRKEGDRLWLCPVTEQVMESNDPHIEPVGSGSSLVAEEHPEESPSPTWDFRILIAAVAMRV